jgi:type II secretory pathway component GspD/PulD (secretin)
LKPGSRKQGHNMAARGLLWAAMVCITLVPTGGLLGQGVRVTDDGLLFDFQDADLRLVISALAEAGNLNVLYGDVPPRRVTMRMNQPVSAEQVLPLLRSIAASNGLILSEEGGFIRLESAGAPDPRAVAEAEGQPSDVRLFVYRLRHARADRMAGTLQSVFGAARGAPAHGPAGLSRQPLSQSLREQRIPPQESDESPQVRVELGATAPSLPGQVQGDIQIVPDEMTNSLLVRAQEGDWEVIRQAIEALDLRPLQVLIEGMIVEVRRTRDLELGVDVRGSDQRPAETRTTVEGELRGQAGDLVLEVMRVGGLDVNVTLSALASTGRVRILSRPVILAQNNQEARILIGAQRPFIQVFRSLPTDAAVRDQVVQYRDVGTSLMILPTINPDGYVNLQISQEVSTATTELQFGAPVISTREASTHLFVRDGQTVVIGGLAERQRDETHSGVPLLKDIPLLGILFRSTRESNTQSELFLFLTPHIIETDEDADRIRHGVETGTELLGTPGKRSILPAHPAPPSHPDDERPDL